MTALQCYAYRRGQRWHAICADLDIAVDGESLRAVEASLETGIDMYLARVAELPAEERGRFLARRAPLPVRASLAVWLACVAVVATIRIIRLRRGACCSRIQPRTTTRA